MFRSRHIDDLLREDHGLAKLQGVGPLLMVDSKNGVYLNYTHYIIILKDAYGCWSLTVHGCVNIHIRGSLFTSRVG